MFFLFPWTFENINYRSHNTIQWQHLIVWNVVKNWFILIRKQIKEDIGLNKWNSILKPWKQNNEEKSRADLEKGISKNHSPSLSCKSSLCKHTRFAVALCGTTIGQRSHPANTRRCPHVGPVLSQRRRRWPNVGPTSGQAAGLLTQSVCPWEEFSFCHISCSQCSSAKTKNQYLLTYKVGRYCLLALHGTMPQADLVGFGQSSYTRFSSCHSRVEK